MAKTLSQKTLKILKYVSQAPGILTRDLFPLLSRSQPYKDFYNNVYRLTQSKLLEQKKSPKGLALWITSAGEKTLKRAYPQKDGVWKLVVFDIPEQQQYVRVILRAKLKSLGFKKWQNSIWVSPYKLDKEIEAELNELAKQFFIRLIQTQNINYTLDLEQLFKDK